MEQYINKAALVAWIENQTESLERNSGLSGIFGETQMAVYDRLYSFLDTLEVKEVDEVPVSNDLEEAAYKASLFNFVDPKNLDDDELRNFDWIKYYEQVFKTGALWKKRQDSFEVKEIDLIIHTIIAECCDWLAMNTNLSHDKIEECRNLMLTVKEEQLKSQKGE